MTGSEIASAIEHGVTSQSELITTLSLAVIGGLLVVLLQTRLHNATNPNNQIQLRYFALFVLAIIPAGLAIALGYAVSGMLVQVAPQLFSHSFDTTKPSFSQDFGPAPIGLLQLLSLIQFVVFFIAVLVGGAFILINRR